MKIEDLHDYLAVALPEFQPTLAPEQLPGGYLNYVWRVPGEPSPVIVKHAPPFIAALPEVKMDVSRIGYEAQALMCFQEDPVLRQIASELVRPPRLLTFDESRCVVIMEDIGQHGDMGSWLLTETQPADLIETYGRELGRFIGELHARTTDNQHLAAAFDNLPVQHTRIEVQYSHTGEHAERAGLDAAEEIGHRAQAFGQFLLTDGICVTMGDLWLASIMTTAHGLRIIDWEFAHYGHPSLDIAHLTAHLWMHEQHAPDSARRDQVAALRRHFFAAYRAALGDQLDTLIGVEGRRRMATHFGAELLARTSGAFQGGYLYDGLALDDPQMRKAAQTAQQHIMAPENVDTFAALA